MIPQLTQPHHLEALGWSLIHFCWQAAAIALAYKAADFSFIQAFSGKRPAGPTRYLLALIAMLGMFVTAAGTLIYEELHLRHAASSLYETNAVTNLSAAPASVPAATVNTTADASLRTGIASALPRPEALLPWLDALWMLGVLVLSVRTVGGWWLIQRLRSTATQQVPPELAASFARLSRRIGVHTRVALRLSNRIVSPLAVGMVRSLILLPASALTTLTPEQLEAVLAHELAHIRRADYLWNILQTMIETLFFFHPAVWWVGANLRQQRELCCDDIAIASCADPVTYATALLLLEEQRAHRNQLLRTSNAAFPLALALDGHQPRFTLRFRIARILGEPFEPAASPRDLAPFSILGVCGALALFLLPLPQVLASLRPAPHPHLPAPAIAASAQQPANSEAPVAQAAPVAISTPAPPAPAAAPAAPAQTDELRPPAPAALAEPAPRPAPFAMPNPNPAPLFAFAMAQDPAQAAAGASKPDYITQMRAAGYDTDLDHYMAMKIHGITPEYAQQMAQIGFGKPSADNLVALKIHGITPAYVAQLNSSGIKPENLQDLISYRIFNVSPEYIAGMKAAGFGDIPTKKLIELRVQNVSPEFARTAKQQFPDVTVQQLVELRIFHIDDAFIAKAKQLGLTPLSLPRLVQLRISGLIEDENRNENRDRDRDRSMEKDKSKGKDKDQTKDKDKDKSEKP